MGDHAGLVYAERYPHRVSEIMLSAITTTRPSEIDWLYRGAGRFFPEEWERFSAAAAGAAGFGGDVVTAYAQLMEDPDPQVRNQAAASWRRWEEVVLSLEPNAKPPAHRLVLPTMTCWRSSGSARTTTRTPDFSPTAP